MLRLVEEYPKDLDYDFQLHMSVILFQELMQGEKGNSNPVAIRTFASHQINEDERS